MPTGESAGKEDPKEIEDYGGDRPGKDGADETRRRRAGNLDAFGDELIRDRRIDADRNKFGFSVRRRFLQCPFDHIRIDDDFGDFFVGDELFELTIGDSLGLPRRIPDLLQCQRGQDCRDEVPHIPSLLFIDFHGRFLCKTQSRSEKFINSDKAF